MCELKSNFASYQSNMIHISGNSATFYTGAAEIRAIIKTAIITSNIDIYPNTVNYFYNHPFLCSFLYNYLADSMEQRPS
jgi:hypothetical protein